MLGPCRPVRDYRGCAAGGCDYCSVPGAWREIQADGARGGGGTGMGPADPAVSLGARVRRRRGDRQRPPRRRGDDLAYAIRLRDLHPARVSPRVGASSAATGRAFARSSAGPRRRCATCAARACRTSTTTSATRHARRVVGAGAPRRPRRPGREPGSSPTTRMPPTTGRCSSMSSATTSAAASHWHQLYGQWIIIGRLCSTSARSPSGGCAGAEDLCRVDAARRQGALRRRPGRARQPRVATTGAGADRRHAPSPSALIPRDSGD